MIALPWADDIRMPEADAGFVGTQHVFADDDQVWWWADTHKGATQGKVQPDTLYIEDCGEIGAESPVPFAQLRILSQSYRAIMSFQTKLRCGKLLGL